MSTIFDAGNSDGPGFVGIRFCQECNNMLYPKEDKENKILLYACRNCDYKQEADSNCIYVNKIMHEIDSQLKYSPLSSCLKDFRHENERIAAYVKDGIVPFPHYVLRNDKGNYKKIYNSMTAALKGSGLLPLSDRQT
ncbi:uncharacterized protein LOC119642960 isoform X1 [Glossina fuscipes]|uniref:Uncharacterized protein LOC119642960 isoform X1 n=1 Tax=Glossina fuscipes TaxID=7396 RepID=A0A9C5ZCZ5_9MUSC|nr:uncharacterized protein LOC119642960 isoform X1 [Glossina fuscipes]